MYLNLPSCTRPMQQDQPHCYHILLFVVRQFLSVLRQPNFSRLCEIESEISECRIGRMTLQWLHDRDVVNKSILAPAIRRFHMKCGVPWRRATASCPHRCQFGCEKLPRIVVNGYASDWWQAEKGEWKFTFTMKFSVALWCLKYDVKYFTELKKTMSLWPGKFAKILFHIKTA